MPRDSVQTLIDQGRIAEAALKLEQQGELARAADLYEQVWDFSAAARVAHANGDRVRALGAALRGKDRVTAETLVEELCGGPAAEREAAAALCVDRGAPALAGRLHLSAGQPARAAEQLSRAGLHLEAGQAAEQAGDLRGAVEHYHRLVCADGTGEPVATADALPLYRWGRALLLLGRLEQAIPPLQRVAARGGELGPAAGRAAAVALHRLGLTRAAAFALEAYGGDAPPTVEACLAAPDLIPDQPEGSPEALAGRYVLGDLLGSGGMGRVYHATDMLDDHAVAVKVFTAPGGAHGRDAYLRFVQEARTTGQLHHPHIVSLLEFNEAQGFMVLELMQGGSLAGRLRGPMDPGVCRSVLLQLLDGLQAAHQRGIVHRDIKPANIFFSTAGAAKLGDFGVAHLQDAGQTQTGAFIGTVAYMSPEQITGEPVTFATDFYALGVTLYQMLTGELPFSPPDLVHKHLNAPPPAPSSRIPTLPSICDEVVLRCLAKAPADRYTAIDDLTRAIERFPSIAPGGAERAEVAPPPAGRGRRATDARFAQQAVLVDLPQVQIVGAQDVQLGRFVILVRVAPRDTRAALMAVLQAAARGGSEHLQRVLSLDPDRGQAVLDQVQGEPVDDLGDERERLLACAHLGRALSALHGAGISHGAVSAASVTRLGGCTILALTPALTGPRAGDPTQDVKAVLSLYELRPEVPVEDGAALARWALARRAAIQFAATEERRRALLSRAQADAPPAVRGR